jgi:adenine phosphoribosyltransferase
MDLRATIRDIPGFPKAGIVFKDITTLLKDRSAFHSAVVQLCEPYRAQAIDQVVGIESRGFIFGAAMAFELGTGFVPVRKPGKLPSKTLKETYNLEYGTDAVEMHQDAIQPGQRVLIVDDLLATGGTAAATLRLVRSLKGIPVGAAFLIELQFLNGRQNLGDLPVHVLIAYEAE